MRRPDDCAVPSGPVRRVLLVGLVAGFLLLTVGVLAAVLGRSLSDTCPLPCEALRRIRAGDCCGLIGLGVLILLITPPIASLALAAGFLRARRGLWAALTVLIVAICVLAVLIHIR